MEQRRQENETSVMLCSCLRKHNKHKSYLLPETHPGRSTLLSQIRDLRQRLVALKGKTFSNLLTREQLKTTANARDITSVLYSFMEKSRIVLN